MDVREQLYDCTTCGHIHKIPVDFHSLTVRQQLGLDPIMNFICPDVARMYRVANYAIDTRASLLSTHIPRELQEQTKEGFRNEWGGNNFDQKLARFIKLNLVLAGIPDEYYDLLNPIISSYCCGYFYPAMTGAGALGERILNRLVLKTRSYFKNSRHYNKVRIKESFDNWDLPIAALLEWKIITSEIADNFSKLKKYRNDAIHYREKYDFEQNSHEAIRILWAIVDGQFNYLHRKDLFWVFNIPGEIWVRSAVLHNPFVKEFILPHCWYLTPLDQPTANPPVYGKNAPLAPLTDEEFIRIRTNSPKT